MGVRFLVRQWAFFYTLQKGPLPPPNSLTLVGAGPTRMRSL